MDMVALRSWFFNAGGFDSSIRFMVVHEAEEGKIVVARRS